MAGLLFVAVRATCRSAAPEFDMRTDFFRAILDFLGGCRNGAARDDYGDQ
jgi:hypothetical protein